MKFNKRQAAAWQKLGEAFLTFMSFVNDPSNTDEMVLDRVRTMKSMEGLSALFGKWLDALPKTERFDSEYTRDRVVKVLSSLGRISETGIAPVERDSIDQVEAGDPPN